VKFITVDFADNFAVM